MKKTISVLVMMTLLLTLLAAPISVSYAEEDQPTPGLIGMQKRAQEREEEFLKTHKGKKYDEIRKLIESRKEAGAKASKSLEELELSGPPQKEERPQQPSKSGNHVSQKTLIISAIAVAVVIALLLVYIIISAKKKRKLFRFKKK